MKKVILLLTMLTSILFTGCRVESEEIPGQTASKINVRASNAFTRSAENNGAEDIIVFTGDDILWFNETTKEIRFKDNASNNAAPVNFPEIGFYIDDEYLFSSMTYVTSLSSQTFNTLVFYYDILGNKYYLTDGYPDASVLSDPKKAQEQRDENMQKIATEWRKFIDQLKREGRYTK